MPLTQKNHVQLKLSKKHRLLFLYKKAYSSSESKAFFKSSILSYAGYSSGCFSYTLVLLKLKENHQGLKHLLYSQSFPLLTQPHTKIITYLKLNINKKEFNQELF